MSHTSLLRKALATACLTAALSILTSCSSTPRSTDDAASNYTTGNGHYIIPIWAPVSEDLSSVRYYYFPDYNIYYDASNGHYMIQNGSSWTSVTSAPVTPDHADLRKSFVVLLSPNTDQPWTRASYYQTNYPASYYQAYPGIVSGHTLITNIPPTYSAIPRAYNEATDNVLFLSQDANGNYVSGANANYNVPMSSIGTYMPANTRDYNYGSGMHHQ